MKAQEFRKLIREEIRKALNEATANPIDFKKLETLLTSLPKDAATFSSPKGDGPRYIKNYIQDLKRIEKILKDGPKKFDKAMDTLEDLSENPYGLEVYAEDPKTFKRLTDLSVALDFSDAANEAAYASDYDALLSWWNKLSKMTKATK